jgi:membrane-bound serine protease (ClpP class)
VIIGAVLLLVAALGFVVAELFVPTHGVLAVIAGICALAAVVVASSVSVVLGVGFGLVVVVATPVVFFYAAKIYPQTAVGKRVLLAPPSPVMTDSGEIPEAAVGDRGVAMTVLRPAGSVEIRGRRVNCVSEAEVIGAGTAVEVIRVAGSRVVVKAV